MNLYLLEARFTVGYDSYIGFVIRAKDELHARSLAFHGDETYEEENFWEDSTFSKCTLLAKAVSGVPGVVLHSYNAG